MVVGGALCHGGIAPASSAVSSLIRYTISWRLGPKNGIKIMSQVSSSAPRRIVWESVVTVVSAAVLISAEVFGAAFAGGWALASLLGLGDYGVYALQITFFLLGAAVMVAFVRHGMHVEPFTTSK
jgi:hypothetical protein